LAGVVPADWEAAVVDERGRTERIPYELCVLRALREYASGPPFRSISLEIVE